MSSLAITIIVGVFLLIVFVSLYYARKGVTETPEPVIHPVRRQEHSQLELDILFHINTEREIEGKSPLVLNDIVSMSCQSHINMCMRVGKVSHTDAAQRFGDLKQMLSPTRLGEVVAYGHKNAESVVEAFLRSADHKKILLGDFNQMGISAQKDSNGKMYVGIITIKVK